LRNQRLSAKIPRTQKQGFIFVVGRYCHCRGRQRDDTIVLSIQNGALVVDGLATQVVIENFEAANDTVTIKSFSGNDVIGATALGTAGVSLVLDGGERNDMSGVSTYGTRRSRRPGVWRGRRLG
jgi:hypothetical protein